MCRHSMFWKSPVPDIELVHVGWLCWQGNNLLLSTRGRETFQVSLCHGSRWDILLLWGLPGSITKRTWGLNGNRVHGGQSAGNCTSDQLIHVTQLWSNKSSGVHLRPLRPPCSSPSLDTRSSSLLYSWSSPRLLGHPCGQLHHIHWLLHLWWVDNQNIIQCHDLSGYSIITGVGFGLMYIPSIVIVSRYLSNFPKDGYILIIISL